VQLKYLFIFLAVTMSACEAVPGTEPTSAPSPLPSITPTPTLPPRSSNAPNENICAGAEALSGLDVSDDQPNTNWQSVHSAGKSFALVKATEGTTFTNPDFATDWAALKTVGMIRGAYHYFHPSLDPLSQANYYLSKIGTLSAGDLPPMFDWEETDGLSASAQIAAAVVWLTRVESVTGKTPMIYVDPSFWNALGNPIEFASYPLFIANYEVACPQIPPPWSTFTFWQQGSGHVAGVQTNAVDLDLFNGNEAQLESFAETGSF
jgi:lysozyme